MERYKSKLFILLPQKLNDRLEVACADIGLSKSEIVRQAIIDYLSKVSDKNAK